ncbi:hypothetical protein KIPB_015605, partial [Kipferlia bialata]|eukprot:g15605.t1
MEGAKGVYAGDMGVKSTGGTLSVAVSDSTVLVGEGVTVSATYT